MVTIQGPHSHLSKTANLLASHTYLAASPFVVHFKTHTHTVTSLSRLYAVMTSPQMGVLDSCYIKTLSEMGSLVNIIKILHSTKVLKQ